MRSIAVFGSSEPLPGQPSWDRAYRVGSVLAGARYRVVTGGYGGVMEAASRGARDAGGTTLGVISALFSHREPNPHLSLRVDTDDLHERMKELVVRGDGYVVLPGRAGTLAELSLVWALERAGSLGRRPVLLLGDEWSELLDLLTRTGVLERSQLELTRRVASPDQVVPLLQEMLPRNEVDR